MKAKIMEVIYLGGTSGPTLEIKKENGEKIFHNGFEVYGALNTKEEIESNLDSNWFLTFYTENEVSLKDIPMKYPKIEEFNEKDLLDEAQEIMNQMTF